VTQYILYLEQLVYGFLVVLRAFWPSLTDPAPLASDSNVSASYAPVQLGKYNITSLSLQCLSIVRLYIS